MYLSFKVIQIICYSKARDLPTVSCSYIYLQQYTCNSVNKMVCKPVHFLAKYFSLLHLT